jgi:tetraacyldisaccharide 4'-kinase
VSADALLPPRSPRSPWQLLYGAALAARRRRRAARAERAPAPVVSVGNLHWGGGGKTPLVVALARHFGEAGHRVAILSRGYRRASRGALVVSRGSGPELEVAAAGDEPYEMATELPGVVVVVGERRMEAARLAAAFAPAPDLYLLDDGFSHVALARDVDLLVFPAEDPFAGGRLLPSGRLREPLAAARHADAVVLTGAGAAGADAGRRLAAALGSHGFAGEGFASATVTAPPRLLSGDVELAPGTPVAAVAAIARPRPFFAAARASGATVVAEMAFPDHHPYPEADLRAIQGRARAAGAAVVLATGKDRAKLEGRLEMPLAVLAIAARPEPAFWTWLDGRLGCAARLLETRE